MHKPLNTLVLGVGGNVSQGIMKALRLSPLKPRVVGACISPYSTGLYAADAAYVSPRADDPTFFEWLVELCDRERVRAVLSGVEPVLDVLAPRVDELREATGAVALVSSPPVLEIGRDKLRTATWLVEQGLGAPATAVADDEMGIEALLAAHGMPLLAKPRWGKGAQGLMQIDDKRDLAWVRGRPDLIVQELLGDPGDEYTVACFCDTDGSVRGTFAMRRWLSNGTTVRAEVGEHAKPAATAQRIARALRAAGPLNVQLRMRGDEAIAFELNVRFSGTAPVRARLGFNDVDAAIRHFVLGEPAWDLPAIRSGLALRYWNELYVEATDVAELAAGGTIQDVARRKVVFEDFGLDE